MTTRSQTVAAEVNALLRARNPLLWIVTREEARAEQYLFEAAAAAGYVARTWDTAAGICRADGRNESFGSPDISDALDTIKARSEASADRGLWILRDAPVWFDGMPGAQTMRKLRNLARALPGVVPDRAQAVVILTTNATIPPDLAAHATLINWPMPDRAEIASILDAALDVLPETVKANALPNGTRDAAIDAAVGLTGEEAQACYAKSLVQTRGRVVPELVSREKRRVIAREKVLEWFDPIPGGIEAVGGLGLLKAWLAQRRLAYSPQARAYGLPAPKGAMLVGPPGTGKSLTAKAIATAWGVPLLRLDMGALKSKFVGDSEANIRKAFSVVEAIGRCVLWIDEIEKALAGATEGGADGGVSTDALGAVLTWMQERQGECFVVATANAVDKLPPELMRAGRFDAVWFLDLPTTSERGEILEAALQSHNQTATLSVAQNVAAATEGFTGSEIAAIVPDAMFAAFSDEGRAITERDLLDAAKAVVPLSKTAAESIAKLREWAKGRARPAGAPESENATSKAKRVLDF